MRIVYLHQYYRTPEMAGGTRSYEFARRLVARGHEVHVVTSDTAPRAGTPAWRVTREEGAIVHWAAVPYGNGLSFGRRISAFGRFARVAAGRAARLPQDVVFATSTPLTIALPAVYAARRNRVPMVFEVRDLWPELPIAFDALRFPGARAAAWRLESWTYRNSAHVIALSPMMADNIRVRFPTVPVTVVPNGCDIDLFADATLAGKQFRSESPWLADRPLVLYAGTLGYANGAGYLVRLAEHLAGTNVCVAIAGTGAHAESIRREAAERGLLDRTVYLLGQRPKKDIVALFGAADLAISTLVDKPCLAASSPNKVFDALAAGRPAAVNYEGWLSDLLRDYQAGLVLPADSAEAAAHIVASFVGDPAQVATTGRNAFRLAAERFDRDTLFDHFEQVLVDAVRCQR
jgi:glycosyltransferase involved in cell wall biosynthesis